MRIPDDAIKPLRRFFDDDVVLLCVIFLFAFFIRLSFLPELIHDPAFLQPVVDSKEHNFLAFQILNMSNWKIPYFWYHTPGYAYFLAVIYKILGHSVVRVALIQYVLGAFCCCLLYLMVKNLINRFAALVAAFLASVFWFLIYSQSHIFSENLSMLLNLLMIYFLLFSEETWRKYLLAGFLLGLSVLVRPEMLPFAGVFALWFLIRRIPLKLAVRNYGLFLAGVSVIVLLLLSRNYELSGEFKIRQQIGVNLYVGSMPDFKGSNVYVPIGRPWGDVTSLPYRELNIFDRTLSESELNAFYTAKVLGYIKEHPFKWSAFIAGKFLSVLVGIDYMRTEDVYFYERYIRGGAFALLQTWHICVLALLGMGLAFRKERDKFLVLFLFLGSYAFAIFFTYKTRYLVSHFPLIIIFTAYAVNEIRSYILEKEWARLSRSMLIGALLALGVQWNPLGLYWPSQAEMYFAMGQNFDYARRYDEAREFYETALGLDPENLSAINALGVMTMKMGRSQEAAVILERALERHPQDSNLLGSYEWVMYYYQQGLTVSEADIYPAGFLHEIDLYHAYFPVPYEGPVYAGTKI